MPNWLSHLWLYVSDSVSLAWVNRQDTHSSIIPDSRHIQYIMCTEHAGNRHISGYVWNIYFCKVGFLSASLFNVSYFIDQYPSLQSYGISLDMLDLTSPASSAASVTSSRIQSTRKHWHSNCCSQLCASSFNTAIHVL